MNAMVRSAAIHGGLLAVLLGAAWVKWTAEPSPDLEGEVVLLQGEADAIEKIIWLSEKKDQAVIERKTDDRGAYLWVTYTRWKEKKVEKPPEPPRPDDDTPAGPDEAPADGEADGEEPAADGTSEAAPEVELPEPEPEYDETVQVFKAGANGDTLLADLSPMTAIRKIDSVPDGKLETIGLDAPREFIELVRKGRTHKLELGGEVYGTRDRYVRDIGSGEIFLVDDEILRPLKYARTRLPDRTLWSLEDDAIVSATIIGPEGANLELDHLHKDDKAKATWVRAAAPDEVDDEVKTWMDKAMGLKGTSYADPADPPTDLAPAFSLKLTGEDGTAETLEVLREGEDGDWWGRSEHTRGLIKMLRGPSSGLAEDVASLVTAD